ncbi:hypothetical protein HU200_045206 [Digitaria exilis]|uniref:Plant bHLH transcription factor ACT-like domain-containing protein n=1 Tax=Digitaria exilis TaxID=1010633 RepID=A0A835B144_9POAL|nr:hypothetical protein HU200_045206 [Digitaria exilis]
MEDTSLVFTKWASPNPGAAAADHGSSRATFPTLYALREASHAAEMVQELIADDVVHAPNSSSSGDIIAANNWNLGATSAALPGSNNRRDGGDPGHSRYAAGSGVRAAATAAADDDEEEEISRRPSKERGGIHVGIIITSISDTNNRTMQRFISDQMDKATILSDATSYVEELQEKVKDMEAGRSSIVETRLVVVKRPCLHLHASPVTDDDGSPSPGTPSTAWQELPEIEARFSESEKSVMVRVHCENSKGVLVKVLTEMEELKLTIIHANVMMFPACTLTMAITAKASVSSAFD